MSDVVVCLIHNCTLNRVFWSRIDQISLLNSSENVLFLIEGSLHIFWRCLKHFSRNTWLCVPDFHFYRKQALEGASKLILNMFFFVYIVKQNKNNSWIFKILKNLMKIEFWWRQIFKISIIHNPSLWSRDVPQKIWTRSGSAVLTFIGHKQTDKQTDRQAKFIYRCVLYHIVRFNTAFILFLYKVYFANKIMIEYIIYPSFLYTNLQ